MKNLFLVIHSFLAFLANAQQPFTQSSPGVVSKDMDNSLKRKIRLTGIYGGVGIGLGRKATPAGISSTFILSNNIGGSISYKHKALLAENLPDNYSAGRILFF